MAVLKALIVFLLQISILLAIIFAIVFAAAGLGGPTAVQETAGGVWVAALGIWAIAAGLLVHFLRKTAREERLLEHQSRETTRIVAAIQRMAPPDQEEQ